MPDVIKWYWLRSRHRSAQGVNLLKQAAVKLLVMNYVKLNNNHAIGQTGDKDR